MFIKNENPLGLPAGSVRSIIALTFVVAFVFGFLFWDKISGEQIENIILIVIGFYFGSKINS